MSIATEFESTRENVQKAYTSLNKLGETASNKNIENISSLVDNIYHRLPKTTYQTGTNINLGKTLKAVVQYEDDKVLYGDTSQETTTGKNKLSPTQNFNETINGINYIGDNGEYSINGTITGESSSNFYDVDNYVIQDKDYLHFMNITSNSNASFKLYFSDETIRTLSFSSTNRIFDLSTSQGKTLTKIGFAFIGGLGESVNITLKPMIINNVSVATPFEKYTGGIPSPNPSFPENINVVTGTQEVVVRGKNLLKLANGSKTDRGITGTITNYNELTWSGTPTTTWCDIIERQSLFLKAGTYKFSINQATPNGERIQLLFYKDSTSSATTYTIWGGQTNVTCTFTDDITEVRGALANLTSGTSTNVSVKMQIEEGSTATTYEPYITPTTYQLHLGSLELAKIGTYQDYIYFDVDEGKWYKKGYIGKITYNGTEQTWYDEGGGAPYTTNVANSIISTSNSNPPLVYCNYFTPISYNSTWTNYSSLLTTSSASGGNTSKIKIRYTDVESLSAFKTWLGTHNTLVYYVLATATDEEITDETLIQDLDNIYSMMSVEGTTIIEVSGNLPAPIKVRAVKGE